MHIREAQQHDWDRIIDVLMEQFTKPPFNETGNRQQVRESLDFSAETGKILVALNEEETLMGVSIFRTERWWEGYVIMMEELAVTETAKGYGVGKELLRATEQYARDINARQVLLTTEKQAAAVQFYEKHGYGIDEDTIIMKKRLQ